MNALVLMNEILVMVMIRGMNGKSNVGGLKVVTMFFQRNSEG